MTCPFCLEAVRFRRQVLREDTGAVFVCSQCGDVVPTVYVRDYSEFPPVVVSVIGHRGHGKTVSIASLFYTIKRLDVNAHWPDFYFFPLNEDSLENVYRSIGLLAGGALPDASPKIFPRPTMVQVAGIPFQRNATLLFYDTAGEAFERASQLERYAGFVQRARTALFLVSLPKIVDEGRDPADEMEKLLHPYVQAMADLGQIERQHLVVVYTCGDAVTPMLADWPDIHAYLSKGTMRTLREPRRHLPDMWATSERLRSFTQSALGARQFLNLAERRFRSVDFSIISALGAAPQDGRLAAEIEPRRIFDPLLWMMERHLPRWHQAWRRWRWQSASGSP